MIIFAPAYDEQTKACAQVAQHVSASVPGKKLIAADANRGAILKELAAADACMIFSHGAPDIICGQNDSPALYPEDLPAINHKAPIYAYACYSAFFGRNSGDSTRVWWGYDKSMVPPPLGILKREDIVGVFRYISHRFSHCASIKDVEQLVEEIHVLCESRVALYRRNGSASMTSMVFFMQLWTRLRILTPWSDTPVLHAESWQGDLDEVI